MNRYADFRILIVDDNQNNLFTLRALIEKHMAVEVLEADSGQAALDIALQDPRIDLVVLDVQMPDMDGLAAAEQIRDSATVPVILVSALLRPRPSAPNSPWTNPMPTVSTMF